MFNEVSVARRFVANHPELKLSDLSGGRELLVKSQILRHLEEGLTKSPVRNSDGSPWVSLNMIRRVFKALPIVLAEQSVDKTAVTRG
jgi:hypothetical protein